MSRGCRHALSRSCSYPDVPIISQIIGCPVNVSLGTSECPTTGAIPITIYGSKFPSNPVLAGLQVGVQWVAGTLAPLAQVFVGTETCASPSSTGVTIITCTLPRGVGLNVG